MASDLGVMTVTIAELSGNRESSVELIKLDVSRTFPQLCIFQQVSAVLLGWSTGSGFDLTGPSSQSSKHLCISSDFMVYVLFILF